MGWFTRALEQIYSMLVFNLYINDWDILRVRKIIIIIIKMWWFYLVYCLAFEWERSWPVWREFLHWLMNLNVLSKESGVLPLSWWKTICIVMQLVKEKCCCCYLFMVWWWWRDLKAEFCWFITRIWAKEDNLSGYYYWDL